MSIATPQGIGSKDDFNEFVGEIEGQEGYERPYAFGVGLAARSKAGQRLDTWFPHTNVEGNYGSAAVIAHEVGHKSGTKTYPVATPQIREILAQFSPFLNDGQKHPNIDVLKDLLEIADDTRKEIVATFIGADIPNVVDVSDAYLRLHLLSHLKVKPNGINLEGIFGKLPNVAWTSEGPIAIDDLEERRLKALKRGTRLIVYAMDKFPAMLDYVTPDKSVRIVNARNVRLGAYVGPGTTVMTAGSINFNSGTVGKQAMVEGRISAGVTVGSSDIGGGASTQGTLSGGGKEKIVIGDACLIGANAGTGISLGDGCTVDAGLYLTAGTKVRIVDAGQGGGKGKLSNGNVVQARELSGLPDLFFRRDSQTGRVEVRVKPNGVPLNEALHR